MLLESVGYILDTCWILFGMFLFVFDQGGTDWKLHQALHQMMFWVLFFFPAAKRLELVEIDDCG